MNQLNEVEPIRPMYKNTNEPLESILSGSKVTGRRVLSVLASGVYPLEFLRRGAKEVVAVDANLEQILWSKLYFVSIENLPYEQFKRVFWEQEGREVLLEDEDYRTAIAQAFGEDSLRAFETISSEDFKERLVYPLHLNNSFRNLYGMYQPKYYRWASKKAEYEKVQQSLRERKLRVVEGEIPNCLEQFEDESFDLVYLSNVVEWLETETYPHLKRFKVESTKIQLARILRTQGTAFLTRCSSVNELRRDWYDLFEVERRKDKGYKLQKK